MGGRAEPGDEVIVYVGGVYTLTTTADSTEEARWRVDVPLAEGLNEIRARARDRADNESGLSACGWVVRDTQPPVIGSAGVWPVYARPGTTMVVTATVQEDNLAQVLADFEVMPASLMSFQGGVWQAESLLPGSGLEDGFSTVMVMAEDRVGFTANRVLTFTIDGTPPDAGLTEIAENLPNVYVSGDTVYYGQGEGSFEVRVTAGDALAGLERVVFPATVSAGGVYTAAGPQFAHPYTFTLSSTAEGVYQVAVYDRAGNDAGVPFTVTRDYVAPVAGVSVPAKVPTDTFTVIWSATDDDSGVAVYDVQVKVDDGEWTSWLTATTATEGVYSGELGHRYTFRVRATDHVSNVGDWAEASTIVAQVTKYYTFGGQRIAMRQGDVEESVETWGI